MENKMSLDFFKIILIVILLILFIFNLSAAQSANKNNDYIISTEQLIENLRNKIYTGEKIEMLRLNKAPIKNLFVNTTFDIEPIFAKYSKLKWEVDNKCKINISIKCDNIPWDEALALVIKENNLEIINSNDVLIIQTGNRKKISGKTEIKTAEQMDSFVFSEINRPEYMKIFDNNIYISDSGIIKVYSLLNFVLKKEIGSFGQGPGEFQAYPFIENMGKISLLVSKANIVIGSRNKVSYFSLSGKLVSEIKTTDTMAYHLLPFNDGYVGIKVIKNPKLLYEFNLYNDKGKFSKNLCTYEKKVHTSAREKSGLRMLFLSRLLKGPEYQIYRDKLYISGGKGFSLDVYDKKGKKINKINYNYETKKISKKEKQNIINVYKSSGSVSYWNVAKKIIKIPDYYPEFRTFKINRNIVYFQTYKRKKGHTEFILFSKEGKYLKTIYLPLTYKTYVEPYPFEIYNDCLYSFIENDDGDWKIDKVKIY